MFTIVHSDELPIGDLVADVSRQQVRLRWKRDVSALRK